MMISDYQPLDPADVDAETVARLRSMWRQGLPVAELARFLFQRGFFEIPVKISLEAAFHLERGDAMAIGGWEPDGTGELSDEQLHKLIAPRIESKRPIWDELAWHARDHARST